MSRIEMSDEWIENRVKDAILWDQRVHPKDLKVIVKRGIVTLSGSVPEFSEILKVEAAVDSVIGLSGSENRVLNNGLRVTPPVVPPAIDKQISEGCLRAIRAGISNIGHLSVTCESGWLTLCGEAEWNYQRIFAESAARKLPGVSGVTNNIQFLTDCQAETRDIAECSDDRIENIGDVSDVQFL